MFNIVIKLDNSHIPKSISLIGFSRSKYACPDMDRPKTFRTGSTHGKDKQAVTG